MASSQDYLSKPPPEVIRDYGDFLVVYKPPYWKCDLPRNFTQEASKPLASLFKQSVCSLPVWLKMRVKSINGDLFDPSFNAAISGTGFGPLAHRLDREVSGPMLVCKTKSAYHTIRKQFHKLSVGKRYICLVHGHVLSESGTIDVPIRALRTGERIQAEVCSRGEPATSFYEVVNYHEIGSEAFTLMSVKILTGRAHQIRVHMQHIGHPLVSDDKYGEFKRKWCNRIFLHCYELSFDKIDRSDSKISDSKCSDRRETILCPLPDDLKKALAKLGTPILSVRKVPHTVPTRIFHLQSQSSNRSHSPEYRPQYRIRAKIKECIKSSRGAVTLQRLYANAEMKKLLQEEGLARVDLSYVQNFRDDFRVTRGQRGDVVVLMKDASADVSSNLALVQMEIDDVVEVKKLSVREERYLDAATSKELEHELRLQLALLRFGVEPASMSKTHRFDESGVPIPLSESNLESSTRVAKVLQVAEEIDASDELSFPALDAYSNQVVNLKQRTAHERLEELCKKYIEACKNTICDIQDLRSQHAICDFLQRSMPNMGILSVKWLEARKSVFRIIRDMNHPGVVSIGLRSSIESADIHFDDEDQAHSNSTSNVSKTKRKKEKKTKEEKEHQPAYSTVRQGLFRYDYRIRTFAVHCDADNASVDDLLRKRHVAEVHTESMSQEESDDTNSRNDTADHRSLPTKIDSKTIESCATPTDPKKMIAQDVKACIRKSSSSWLPVESVYADVPLLKVLLGSARPHTACTLLKVALNGSGIHSEVREGVLQVGI